MDVIILIYFIRLALCKVYLNQLKNVFHGLYMLGGLLL